MGAQPCSEWAQGRACMEKPRLGGKRRRPVGRAVGQTGDPETASRCEGGPVWRALRSPPSHWPSGLQQPGLGSACWPWPAGLLGAAESSGRPLGQNTKPPSRVHWSPRASADLTVAGRALGDLHVFVFPYLKGPCVGFTKEFTLYLNISIRAIFLLRSVGAGKPRC